MIDEVWRCEKTFCCCVVVGGFPPPLFHPRPSPAMQLSSPPHHAVQRRSRAALGERPHAVVQCVYQWRVLMACTNGGCTNGCTADGGGTHLVHRLTADVLFVFLYRCSSSSRWLP